MRKKAGPYRYLIPLGIVALVVGVGYPGFKKLTRFQMAEALSVTVESTSPIGEEKAIRAQLDKIFDLACQNYWILKFLTPDERERAKGILLRPYYQSPMTNGFADPHVDEKQRVDQYVEEAKTGKFSGFSPAFRGFYWQARLDSLTVDDRRRVEWVMRAEDRTAVNEVRELRESLKEMFYMEYNGLDNGKTNYLFQVCNKRSQPLTHVDFWVSGFHRGGVSPQSLGRAAEKGSSTEFQNDKEIPGHQCGTFSVNGDYRLFDNFEVTTAVGTWPDHPQN